MSGMVLITYMTVDAYRKFLQGGGKLGPHKRMTLAIMIIAYIYNRKTIY